MKAKRKKPLLSRAQIVELMRGHGTLQEFNALTFARAIERAAIKECAQRIRLHVPQMWEADQVADWVDDGCQP
jgi:hypothetical protein